MLKNTENKRIINSEKEVKGFLNSIINRFKKHDSEVKDVKPSNNGYVFDILAPLDI